MAVNLQLDEMSFEEKLQVMEAIWLDSSREPDRLESPNWHQDILEETETPQFQKNLSSNELKSLGGGLLTG
jgi:Putative addiction module component